VKLNVIKHIEAGEHQLNVCEVLDLAGLRAWSILKNKNKVKECGKYFKGFEIK
jgi:hypothetical protein